VLTPIIVNGHELFDLVVIVLVGCDILFPKFRKLNPITWIFTCNTVTFVGEGVVQSMLLEDRFEVVLGNHQRESIALQKHAPQIIHVSVHDGRTAAKNRVLLEESAD
jgi:hypothetical protein